MVAAPGPESRKFTHFSEIAGFIWQVADLLRRDYKQSDYGKVILPLCAMGSFECRHTRATSPAIMRGLPAVPAGPVRHWSQLGNCPS